MAFEFENDFDNIVQIKVIGVGGAEGMLLTEWCLPELSA